MSSQACEQAWDDMTCTIFFLPTRACPPFLKIIQYSFIMKVFTSNLLKFPLTLLALFVVTFLAAQNPTISIQGTLKSANGSSVADGPYDVTFRLYNVTSGGSALWEEDATVDVIGSIYSHYLGSVTPLNAANFSSTVYVGVTIGNYELVPRTELSYAPYSFAVYGVICSGGLGDIKYSILNPTQFAMVNGSCWVPMDGTSMAGSALAALIGNNTKPNGGGLFLRSQEFANSNNDPSRDSNSPIAAIQNQAVQSHNHGINDPGHNHGHNDYVRNTTQVAAAESCCSNIGDNTFADNSRTTANSTTGITIQNAGGPETRPKNMNFWVYIRIN